jgi:hypothetical protein
MSGIPRPRTRGALGVISGVERCRIDDVFGNRIELISDR